MKIGGCDQSFEGSEIKNGELEIYNISCDSHSY